MMARYPTWKLFNIPTPRPPSLHGSYRLFKLLTRNHRNVWNYDLMVKRDARFLLQAAISEVENLTTWRKKFVERSLNFSKIINELRLLDGVHHLTSQLKSKDLETDFSIIAPPLNIATQKSKPWNRFLSQDPPTLTWLKDPGTSHISSLQNDQRKFALVLKSTIFTPPKGSPSVTLLI